MTLLEEYMHETGTCVMMDRTTSQDGYGDIVYTYVDGAEFDAAIVLKNSLNTQVAEQQGVKGVYEVYVKKSIRLPFQTVFRRTSDGKVFRVTSRDDDFAPNSASADMVLRRVNAEEYEVSE